MKTSILFLLFVLTGCASVPKYEGYLVMRQDGPYTITVRTDNASYTVHGLSAGEAAEIKDELLDRQKSSGDLLDANTLAITNPKCFVHGRVQESKAWIAAHPLAKQCAIREWVSRPITEHGEVVAGYIKSVEIK